MKRRSYTRTRNHHHPYTTTDCRQIIATVSECCDYTNSRENILLLSILCVCACVFECVYVNAWVVSWDCLEKRVWYTQKGILLNVASFVIYVIRYTRTYSIYRNCFIDGSAEMAMPCRATAACGIEFGARYKLPQKLASDLWKAIWLFQLDLKIIL